MSPETRGDQPEFAAAGATAEVSKVVAFRSATITWPSADDDEPTKSPAAITPMTPSRRRFQLEDLSADFPEGELSLVCGTLGSGKSLLLLGTSQQLTREPCSDWALPNSSSWRGRASSWPDHLSTLASGCDRPSDRRAADTGGQVAAPNHGLCPTVCLPAERRYQAQCTCLSSTPEDQGYSSTPSDPFRSASGRGQV